DVYKRQTKGGGTNTFWKYTPGAGWTMAKPIPVIDKKHAPKSGAAMAYADGKVWLLVGNKTPDFWCYTPGSEKLNMPQDVIASNSEAISNSSFMFNVNPNPFTKHSTIRYTVPISGNVTIKLYNASGRLIKTLVNDYLKAGSYTTTLTNIASGVYFLKYESAHNKAEVKLTVR
ncbi:MAG: T9SS type A sorting domain-containing protein, partial [candidate division WOR-3 bacterium]|nr:T9SS type A sorting domain-containing protein [candidate division WOR-3 bacterium]